MSSTPGQLGRALWQPLRTLALSLSVLLLGALPALAAAPLPERIPGGYSAERDGDVRWIFPTSAEAEVRDLMVAQREGWKALAHELGAELGTELDIRVGLNPGDMQKLAPPGARLPGYASGVAFPADGLILLTFTAPGTFLRPNMEAVLTHELAHVALHRAVDGNRVPRWFTEGVAIDQAGERSIARVRTLWDGTLRGDLLPLSELSKRFPGHHSGVNLAYAQSADLVRAMLDGPGDAERFRKLIEGLRDQAPFAEAFAAAYDETLSDFERDWRVELSQRFGRWPSLLMGLTAVWVLGALLLVLGYVRVRAHHRRTLARWAIEEAPLAEGEEVPAAALAAAQPPPPPQPRRTAADAVLDEFADDKRRDSKVPTVVHDGQSYTLH